jgi:hypothetical protein
MPSKVHERKQAESAIAANTARSTKNRSGEIALRVSRALYDFDAEVFQTTKVMSSPTS